MGGDTVKEKLAEAFSNFNCFALPVVGKSIGNYRFVVLVDNVVLGSAGGKDDRATYRDTCTYEWWCSDIFVVNKRRVDTAECCIGGVLSSGIVVAWRIVVLLLEEVT